MKDSDFEWTVSSNSSNCPDRVSDMKAKGWQVHGSLPDGSWLFKRTKPTPQS